MNLDDLRKIEKVEAPPFLHSRILQKIANLDTLTLPAKTVWALGLSFLLVILLNSIVLTGYGSNSNATEAYARSINLISNYSLYK